MDGAPLTLGLYYASSSQQKNPDKPDQTRGQAFKPAPALPTKSAFRNRRVFGATFQVVITGVQISRGHCLP
jgi:hypothetical protein